MSTGISDASPPSLTHGCAGINREKKNEGKKETSQESWLKERNVPLKKSAIQSH